MSNSSPLTTIVDAGKKLEIEVLGFTISQERVAEWLMMRGADLVAALLILLVGWMIARGVRRLVVKLMARTHADMIVARFTANLLFGFIMLVVLVAAIGKMGVPTTSLVAMIGAAGLAIGLAFQKSLSNFAAGLMILFFKHFKEGDSIISQSGADGVVLDLNVFTTTLLSKTNEKIIVPNSMLTENVMINQTANDQRRIDYLVGVSYEDDLDKVRAAITKVLKADPRVLENPLPAIGIEALAESSVNFSIHFWVKREHYADVKQFFLGEVKREFDAQGIRIPYPQRELRLLGDAAVLVKKDKVA